MKIELIDIKEGYRLIHKFHYSKVLPKLTKYVLGHRNDNGDIDAVMTLGWGVRPKHTIKKLFPRLSTEDYLEIGKLCLDDKLPRNSESQFISSCLKEFKKYHPEIALIFTWADGMLGKPGFVYQACNFLYGGFIWTDSYFFNGEKIHPRATGKIGGRPNNELLKELGWEHYRGKQFRYCYFLCSHKEQKQLLKESTVIWSTNYPKMSDLCWKKYVDGKWIISNPPEYNGSLKFNNSSKIYNWYKNNPTLSEFDADEVSREKHLVTNKDGVGQFHPSALVRQNNNVRT